MSLYAGLQGGPKHGPYYARYWWQDGRRYKRYMRQDDAAAAMKVCDHRRAAERQNRERTEAMRQGWRNVRALIREIEHGEY